MRFLFVFLLTSPLLSTAPLSAETLSYTHFESTQETSSVTVKRSGLVHTKLLGSQGRGDLESTFGDLFTQISIIAAGFETSTASVVKLNIYHDTSEQSKLDHLRSLIHSRWPKGKAPALTLIPSKLPGPLIIAGDAVIAADPPSTKTYRPNPVASFLPSSRDIIYVSGRAASGELAPATAQTMTQIFETLAHRQCTPQDIVQVKAFIQPIDQWKVVEAEIAKSFDGKPPPIVYAEWTSSSRATEIEVIAASPNQEKGKGPVTYLTPPEDKKSPVYSRVATIHSNEVIYFSGHHSSGSEDDARDLFARLKQTAKSAGTNLQHFAKATYYVTTPESSASLNAIRPGHYDPERPPAASKVMIRSLGQESTQMLIDMIAAPVGK